MSLSSTSTPDEILAEYNDTCDYFVTGSVAKCKRFIIACHMLLVSRPAQSSIDGTMMTFTQGHIEKQLQIANRWMQQNGGASGTRTASRRWDMGDIRQ